MTVIQLIALFLIVIVFILLITYGVSINRNAKTESDKVFLTRFFIVLGITFVAGGITRTIQQNTGIEWLNGVVAIFGGLFLSLWGVPIFRRISNNRERGLKAWLLFLAGIFIILLGFSVIILGITQVWKALL